MNKKVEKRLEEIKKIALDIQAMCECILEDAEDATSSGDLFVIESQFERIGRKADDGYSYVRNTYDEFDEE